ncbi:uncharacterized protein LOC134697896 [Mytilus trossulus]|uniref:uncharacterized protein LOC134697896 n=1 Tax=Mytilus trossulus TaxID=6551 RepID=UPI003003DE21
MNVFNEYNSICVTTVLLISSFSTFAGGVCTLPTELHNSVWNYQYTDLSNNAQTTTLTFGRTTLPKPSNIELNALGTTLNAWTCISNLTLSSAVSVAVFKSDKSYTDANRNTKWVYICMKLTKVADDFFYFYLLSDKDSNVYPEERVYQSGSISDNTVPVCSTFCQYTTQPRIRTLKKSGSSANLPLNTSLCEPCDSACEKATTEMTPTETTQEITSTEMDTTTDMTSSETNQKTTQPSKSTEIDTTTDMTSSETNQKTTQPSTSSEVDTTMDMTSTETNQKTTQPPTFTEMDTTTDMTTSETNQITIQPSTSTEIDTTTDMTLKETNQITTQHSTSTEMDTSTGIKSTETEQKTTEIITTYTKTTTDIKDDTPIPTKPKGSCIFLFKPNTISVN